MKAEKEQTPKWKAELYEAPEVPMNLRGTAKVQPARESSSTATAGSILGNVWNQAGTN